MIDPNVQLAAEALARGNGERALQHLSGVADLEDPHVWNIRALALANTGATEAAATTCHRGLAVDPDHHGLHLTLAGCLEDLGRHAEAERSLIGVLNRTPDNEIVLTRYAWLLARTGDAAGARSVIERLPPARLSNSASILALLGYVAMIEGRRREARSFLDRAMAADPEAGSTRMLLSLEAALNGRPMQAADHMLAAASLDPEVAGEQGRLARYVGHPLMAPTRFITRIGQARAWLVWMAIVILLPQIWPDAPMGWIILTYLCFAIYTWTVPFLLRKWLIWRGRL